MMMHKLEKREKETCILITGSILSGFDFWGPFDSLGEAAKYADRNFMESYKATITIQKPEFKEGDDA